VERGQAFGFDFHHKERKEHKRSEMFIRRRLSCASCKSLFEIFSSCLCAFVRVKIRVCSF